MGRIVIFPVYLAGADYFDRQCALFGFHGMHLHARGLGAQHDLRIDIEGILHITGRMVLGQI